jgi:hypothetical protein
MNQVIYIIFLSTYVKTNINTNDVEYLAYYYTKKRGGCVFLCFIKNYLISTPSLPIVKNKEMN